MENQGFDFKKGPAKLFVDTAHMRIIDGLLHMNAESGTASQTLLFALPLAKKIAKAIVQQVEEIEKKNGITFDDRLPNEPMPSPMTFETPPNHGEDGAAK